MLVVVLGAVAAAMVAVVRAQARWRAATRTEADGTLVIAVARPGGHERVVRRLAPGLEGWELGPPSSSSPREEAEGTARELNR